MICTLLWIQSFLPQNALQTLCPTKHLRKKLAVVVVDGIAVEHSSATCLATHLWDVFKIVANLALQMFYGEDGVDVMNINYMQKFEFLAKNAVTFARRLDLPNALLAGKVRSHFTACSPHSFGVICARVMHWLCEMAYQATEP